MVVGRGEHWIDLSWSLKLEARTSGGDSAGALCVLAWVCALWCLFLSP
jgi:hypothetical protein